MPPKLDLGGRDAFDWLEGLIPSARPLAVPHILSIILESTP